MKPQKISLKNESEKFLKEIKEFYITNIKNVEVENDLLAVISNMTFLKFLDFLGIKNNILCHKEFMDFDSKIGQDFNIHFVEFEKTVDSKVYQDLKILLDSYTFSFSENDINPEMLGKTFENLLGLYNPESKESARKQTGSYYTPKEIVNYMCSESLIQHVKTKNDNLDESIISDWINKEVHTFNEKEKKDIIHSLITCKILDPAVGSGAFPIGMLLNINRIMDSIDKDGEILKNILMDIDDKEIVIKDFETNTLNFNRKVYITNHCLYGVDIQPMAIQICFLVFYIYFLMEDLKALPNLEDNFIVANALLGKDYLEVKNKTITKKETKNEIVSLF